MEKSLFTAADLQAKCARRVKTDIAIYLSLTVLLLCLGALLSSVLPGQRGLLLAFFGGAAFFLLLTLNAFGAKSALKKGRYTVSIGTVTKKIGQRIMDTRAHSLQLALPSAPRKRLTAADLTLEEFAAAQEGASYYVFLRKGLWPQFLAIVPAAEYTLAPPLQKLLTA